MLSRSGIMPVALLSLCGACSPAFTADQGPWSRPGGTPTPSGDEPEGPDTAALTAGDTAALPVQEEGEGEADVPTPCDAWNAPAQVGTVEDGELNEISGIVASRVQEGVLWVQEDHAGASEIYALNAAGETLGTIVVTGATNNDWEDLAIGPCGDEQCIWIGEIGNNNLDRTALGLYRFVEPVVDLAGGWTLSVEAEWFPFVYPDGNWNAESLGVMPDGTPVVLSKEYTGEFSGVYSMDSLSPGEQATLTYRGAFSTGDEGEGASAAATAADIWPDGGRVLVRTYGHLWEYTLGGAGLDGVEEATRAEVPFASERQGEAVGYDPKSIGFWQVSEDPNPPLYYADCAVD
jgi:hypothetical protein